VNQPSSRIKAKQPESQTEKTGLIANKKDSLLNFPIRYFEIKRDKKKGCELNEVGVKSLCISPYSQNSLGDFEKVSDKERSKSII